MLYNYFLLATISNHMLLQDTRLPETRLPETHHNSLMPICHPLVFLYLDKNRPLLPGPS